MKLLKSTKGFTLIELLVVMAIIAALIAMTIFGVSQAFSSSVETRRQNLAREFQTAIIDFRSETQVYPDPDYIAFNSDSREIWFGDGSAPTNESEAIVKLPVDFETVNISEEYVGPPNYSNDDAQICYGENARGFSLGILMDPSKNSPAGDNGNQSVINNTGEWFFMTTERCN